MIFTKTLFLVPDLIAKRPKNPKYAVRTKLMVYTAEKFYHQQRKKFFVQMYAQGIPWLVKTQLYTVLNLHN